MANVIKLKRGSGSDPVANDLVVGELAIRTDVGKIFTKKDNGSVVEISGSGGGVDLGDYGDIVVSNGGDTWSIDSGVIDNANIAVNAAIAGTKISPNFGSQNIVTTGTVDGRDLSVDGAKLDGIESGATADQTATEILNLIKTVDGSGSGLYADYAKTLVIIDTRNDGSRVPNDYDNHRVSVEFTNQIVNGWHTALTVKGWTDGYAPWQLVGRSDVGQDTNLRVRFGHGSNNTWSSLYKIWHEGSDGAGSGLDADKLDAQEGSYYTNASNLNAGTVAAARLDTATTQSAGNSTTKIATTAFVSTAIANLIDSSPSTLNTLNELAAALGDDASFSTTVTNSLATKLALTGGTVTGQLSLTSTSIYSLDINNTGNDGKIVLRGSNNPYIRFREGNTDKAYIQWHNSGKLILANQESGERIDIGSGSNGLTYLVDGSSAVVWHSLNDGAGSGLDADLWDGNQFASYLNQALLTSSTVSFDRLDISGNHGIDNNGWYRNDASGEGLYNTATTQHFYSDDDDYWNIAGGGSANGLRFRDDHAGTIRGYVYANNSNQVGFLNENADWTLRTESNGITKLGSNGYQLINGNVAQNLQYRAGGNTSDIGISGFNSGGTWKFQLYGATNYYGFLTSNWGSWDIQKNINGQLKIRVSDTLYTVWHNGNDGSGSGLDADLLDGVQRTGFVEHNQNSAYILKFGSGGNSGHTSSSYPYAIFQEGGAWSGSYPDLRINYHTGIIIAAGYASYGGLRFQRDYNDTTELMSIGNGDNHVRVANNLYVSGDINANGGAGALSVAASSDIRLASGNWTGNAYGKIQHHSNALYIGGGSSSDYSIIFRYDGSDRVYIKSDGTIWPQADSSSDLGSSGRYWRNVYADTYYGDGSNLTGISSDLVNDSSPQLGGLLDGNGNTANFTGNTTALGLPRGSTAQAPTASSYEGYIRYDNDDNVVYYSDGAAWKKISSTIPILTTIDGLITNGAASTLTLTGSGFLAASLTVNFAGSGVNANVTVTASSNSSATVTVPAAAYNASAGTVIAIKVTNADGNESGTINKTNTQMPTGGNITTSGNYRIHTFTSSGTFGLTIAGLNVEYLVVAGGGGGGAKRGGGGGAGGMISGTVTAMSTGNKTVTVGGGGGRSGGGFSGGNSGNNSVFDSYTAQRGGSGGCRSNGGSGGSGGGNGRSDGAGGTSGGSGTSGQGNSGGGHGGTHGGSGGGGKNGSGGGGGNGSRGSAGSSAISGTNTNYAEGGQGGTVYGTGGFSSGPGANRPANTGHGADGGDDSPGYTGGAGGSGIVIVRYQL